jgi:hypothetical protein
MQFWSYPNKPFMLLTIVLLSTCATLPFTLDNGYVLVILVRKVFSWNFGLLPYYSD